MFDASPAAPPEDKRGTLLIGATGLVGTAVRRAAVSRPLINLMRSGAAQEELAGQISVIAASEHWAEIIEQRAPDILICCLGTTIGKMGGDAEKFRAIDEHLVVQCGAAARNSGTRHMIVVTSVGASSRAPSLYLNAKGNAEDRLSEMHFPRLDIIRPGLLIGPRMESRPLEAIGQKLARFADPFLLGGLRKYRSIGADSVARAIWKLADSGAAGRFVHEHDAIIKLAG
jgi:uncharacterized protein YbjT (DUF2867 family)